MESVMRLLGAMLAALVLASCGPKSLTLPTDPTDRAATCAVVAAIEARAATTDIKAPLPFEAQEHILHYALLAGAEGERFSTDAANAVTRRMSELQEGITEGKWQDLVPACREAFPVAEVTEPKLPADRFEAQLQCDELGDFITTALQSQDVHYAARLNDYGELARKLDQKLGPGLRARAGADLASQREERGKALAAAARLGSPSAVMKQCVERYG
jgi:hypothetical protein